MIDQMKVIKIPRQTAFLQMPNEEAEILLQEVEQHFGKEWLEMPAGHRLQNLWERSDANSTIDLVSLGFALKTVGQKHSNWVKDCVGDILSEDNKRQNGALFELNLIAWFIHGGMNVTPASYGEKGIDATLMFAGVDDLFVSMKNHDMSHHEQALHQYCESVRAKARAVFANRGYNGVSITLTTKDYLSSQTDWDSIEKAIENWPTLAPEVQGAQVAPGIHLFVAQLDAKANNLETGLFSDNFVAMMPYHKNEQDNFKQKLNVAIMDLKKKCTDRTGRKAIFMRLHQTADMAEMTKFATDLINEPNCAADLIVLYQPAYINDSTQNTTSPSQFFSLIKSSTWDDGSYPIKMRPLIATSIQTPSKQKILWPDGTLKDPPEGHYLHCIGTHFVATQKTGNANLEATVNVQRRPNLSIYPVFDGHFLVGLLPPNDEFLVI